MRPTAAVGPPGVSRWLQRGFHAFLWPYLRRHFHVIAMHRDGCDPRQLPVDEPVIVYGNHPSWWDPMIAHFLNATLFGGRQFFAPIDAAALAQYQVLGKLGFFGVNLDSATGAATFLRTAAAILTDPQAALWITPEGRFCDVRDHSAPLMPGLAHLCAKHRPLQIVPLALEYAFWEERLPVCLVRFGQPFGAESAHWDKPAWGEGLRQRLRACQQALAAEVIARRSDSMVPLLQGSVGAGGIYDTMRRFKSWLNRNAFRPGHGERFSR